MQYKEITEEQIKLLEGIIELGKERFIWLVPNKELDGEGFELWERSNKDLDNLGEMGLVEQMFDDSAVTAMNRVAIMARQSNNPERQYRCFRITEMGWAFFGPVSDWVN